jgi:hypothetical protein
MATKRNRRDIALWYAFGRADAGETLRGPQEEFAAAYSAAWEAYENGSGFMPSIRRAFKMWQAGKPVTSEE